MTVCRLEKQKEATTTTKDLVNQEHGNSLKPNCSEDFQIRVRKALEADDLCYNYETGFHYMRQ